MNKSLTHLNDKVYKKIGLEVSDFQIEKEGQEYGACKFKLGGKNIISRNAKITPKKVGQFVTFWERINNGPIQPYSHTCKLDYLLVNVEFKDKLGQFVFPKSILIDKGIITNSSKEGKRAFRVYPIYGMSLQVNKRLNHNNGSWIIFMK